MIVAAHEHIRNGREPVAPDPRLGHAANFLYMLKGKAPSADAARLMDIDMILHAEHGSNASSFTARVVAGTEADLHARDHRRHRRALRARRTAARRKTSCAWRRKSATPSKAAEYVKAKRANKEPVMGFGHRVYRAEDPRARHMRAGVEKLSREMGQPQWYQILEAVVEAMKPYARHGVNVNVDFYAGVVYFLNGIAEDLFVPIFAVGPRAGLDGAGARAAGEQHPHPPAHAVQRRRAARLRPDRRALRQAWRARSASTSPALASHAPALRPGGRAPRRRAPAGRGVRRRRVQHLRGARAAGPPRGLGGPAARPRAGQRRAARRARRRRGRLGGETGAGRAHRHLLHRVRGRPARHPGDL